ncbi:MAG: hypothetical protein QMD65_01955 [Patescibacteria group bacterium]|nr:hypothetical protein [Patescibacteria group bacterium]
MIRNLKSLIASSCLSIAILGFWLSPRTFTIEPIPTIQEPIKSITSEKEPIEDKNNDLLKRIAICESNDLHYKNGEVLRGRINNLDIGRFQINLFYHKETADKLGLNLFNEKDNETYARYLLETEGADKIWFWSKKCWL